MRNQNQRNQRIIGAFRTYQDAEQACIKLNHAGFPENRVSVVASTNLNDRLSSEVSKPVGNHRAEAATGAITGSMVGAIGGCLLGLGILAVPGFGLVVAAGTTGTTLIATLVGTGIGIACGSSIEILAGLETTTDLARTKVDRNDSSQFEYLVIIDGTDDEAQRAESIVDSCVPLLARAKRPAMQA